ncbi:addiction module protein [Verrucomicrobiaceae bacterium N1E253]|uniref:Addiction module protein n=1 Tax=Oceaniferula marina TaxID=2748318 RepID=A0A851GHB4_9BACT|nr:addiction module protein [Oceaniferula marina]NWK56589.1 addiction module protein [Oceaniferula marina]
MNTAFELMEDVLKLPRQDRSYLAAKIIESLDQNEDLSPEWMEELDRRVESWKSGKSPSVSSEDLHKEMRDRLAI